LPRKAVTIRDVASHAGVSVATASRALNGSAVVSDATRQRILDVVNELGFAPSRAARHLSLGQTLTVGVVVSFLTRPQAAERLRGVDAVLSDSDFDLVIYNVETLEKRDHYLSTLAASHRTDGLLVISLPPSAETAAQLAKGPAPVVFIDVHAPAIAAFPRVNGDDVAGGRVAAEHLVALGHRRIGFIGDEPENPFGFTSSHDRQAGLNAALREHGIAMPEARVGLGAHGRYEARDLARRMLTGDDRPSAIFAASDTQALGVIAAAHDLGLRVPDDLSVIGYDDVEAAEYVGLSTVRQQLFDSGWLGAVLLLGEIGPAREGARLVELTPELVVRETTAPPKEGSDRE
jgi:DNA-binding LacI/PurR family transcriptional regulator